MIGRNNRFHGRASIQRLYKSSEMVRSASLSMRFATNPRRSQYRLAVVVSRKVSKSAVVRNRIRRRIYENVRILSSSFTAPFDLMIVAHDESLAEKPSEEVRAEVEKLIAKAHLTMPDAGRHAIVDPKKRV